MPYCPECKYEYVSGTKTCPDCDEALVEQLPDGGGQGVIDEEFVPVFVAADNEEAQVVMNLLSDSGIPVISQTDAGIWPTLMRNGETLTVPASRVEEAKTAIQQAMKAGEAESEPKDE